jgi:hypothetical protein
MYCAYCGLDHDENVINFSGEEVVPYAVGGSREFGIQVCEGSNNSLGGSVDKPFAEMFAVRAHRCFLGLRGTDGTKPTLDLSGQIQIDNKKFQMKHIIDGKKVGQPEISALVTRTHVENGEHVSVQGGPKAARQILEGFLKHVAAQGKQVRDADGNILKLEDLDALLASRTVEHVKPSILKTIEFAPFDFVRFFAKLALATGHYLCGAPFSRSRSGELLRETMHAKDVDQPTILGARIWPEIEGAEPTLELFQRKAAHVLALLHLRPAPPLFVASLFGDIGAVIPLLELGRCGMSDAPCSGTVLQIELPSRAFSRQGFEDYAAALYSRRRSANEDA